MRANLIFQNSIKNAVKKRSKKESDTDDSDLGPGDRSMVKKSKAASSEAETTSVLSAGHALPGPRGFLEARSLSGSRVQGSNVHRLSRVLHRQEDNGHDAREVGNLAQLHPVPKTQLDHGRN